jgi:hypothetical protein
VYPIRREAKEGPAGTDVSCPAGGSPQNLKPTSQTSCFGDRCMSTATLTGDPYVGCAMPSVGVSLPLDALSEPGTYLCNWSGHLLRVPELDRGHPRFSTAGRNAATWTVTRISADPLISRHEARSLAQRLGLTTSF